MAQSFFFFMRCPSSTRVESQKGRVFSQQRSLFSGKARAVKEAHPHLMATIYEREEEFFLPVQLSASPLLPPPLAHSRRRSPLLFSSVQTAQSEERRRSHKDPPKSLFTHNKRGQKKEEMEKRSLFSEKEKEKFSFPSYAKTYFLPTQGGGGREA